MHVNGRSHPWRAGLTLHALLEQFKLDTRTVAVMHGEQVYRPPHIPDAPLAKGDVVEIVTMMQGG